MLNVVTLEVLRGLFEIKDRTHIWKSKRNLRESMAIKNKILVQKCFGLSQHKWEHQNNICCSLSYMSRKPLGRSLKNLSSINLPAVFFTFWWLHKFCQIEIKLFLLSPLLRKRCPASPWVFFCCKVNTWTLVPDSFPLCFLVSSFTLFYMYMSINMFNKVTFAFPRDVICSNSSIYQSRYVSSGLKALITAIPL